MHMILIIVSHTGDNTPHLGSILDPKDAKHVNSIKIHDINIQLYIIKQFDIQWKKYK